MDIWSILDTPELLEAGLKLMQVASSGTLSEGAALEYVKQVLKASGTESTIKGETLRSYFKNWLDGKKVGAARDTFLRYRTTVDLFLAGLGKRAPLSLSAVQQETSNHSGTRD